MSLVSAELDFIFIWIALISSSTCWDFSINIAFSAVFLVSEQARYINGQVLGVDGGFLSAGLINRNASK